MKKINKIWLQRVKIWLGIGGGVGMVITGNWLSDAFRGEQVLSYWFSDFAKYPGFNIIVAGVFFALSLWLTYSNRHAFLSARTFRYQPCKPRECLVMLISLPDPIPPEGPLPWVIQKIDQPGGRVGNSRTIQGKDLKEDTKALTTSKESPFRWNWQQLMRGLIPHQGFLKEVRMLCSKDHSNFGSHSYEDNAKVLIKTYFPSITVESHKDHVDFEDFNALKSELNEIINTLKKQGYSEDQIIIDVTGGPKTASIAAATVTLNSQMNFQYVRNVDYEKVAQEKDVMSYDVRVLSPLSEGG